MFSRSDLKKLIIPLIIEQILAATIGLADTIMVASCGEAAVSGISLVDSINFLLITLFSSLAAGGAVVSAQYIGKGDIENGRRSANQLLYSSVLISLILMILSIVFRSGILHAVFGVIEDDVMANAKIYFLLSALSYPFLAAYNSGAALFRSMGDSKTSMVTSVAMNSLNLIGNALLIYVFKMGVFGAALSTLIARIVGAAIITALLLNRNRILCYENILKIHFNFSLIKKILYIGIPSGIENSIFQIGKILVASIVAGLGTSSITAYAVAGNIANIQIIPGTAVGMAMVTVVGQCVGAKDRDGARKYTKKLTFLAYIAIWISTAAVLLCLGTILDFYNLSDVTADLTVKAFMIHAICALFIWAPSFALPNAFRAANDVKYSMVVSLCSMWIFRIGCSYLFVHFFHWDVMGVIAAMCVDWLVRAICFTIRFHGKKWLQKTLI